LKLILNKRIAYKLLKEIIKDPKMRDAYDNRQIALKWILVTCFGYLGYKNSKFGTVDGHIGVCAFGREAFLKSARMAENQGFEVVHGIVDSMWLKKKDSTLDEFSSLCRQISREIGVGLNFEGRYKWIVFLSSKMHPHIGVLNRYYGVMENGKLIYDAQMEMIDVLSKANNSAEFMQKIPDVFAVVKKYRQKLINDEVPLWDLVITKHLSKNPKNYKQHVSQSIAADQLIKEGVEIHAGNSVNFIFTDSDNKRYSRRVVAEQFIEKGVKADTEKYLLLLYASAANLLSFKGYTTESICAAVNCNSSTTNLPHFLN
jgi:DNA polymerase elongation subunit (family B)